MLTLSGPQRRTLLRALRCYLTRAEALAKGEVETVLQLIDLLQSSAVGPNQDEIAKFLDDVAACFTVTGEYNSYTAPVGIQRLRETALRLMRRGGHTA